MAIVSLYSAATALTALNTELDVTANNLANVNTVGFRGSRVNFQDLLYQQRSMPGVENATGGGSATGVFVGLGVKVSGTQLDFSRPGSLENTSQPLDLAIDGQGFFQVRVEDDLGPNGVAYTRAGNFTTNSDGDIVLASDTGRLLEPGLNVPPGSKISVGNDGRVYALEPGATEETEVGTIQLATFVNAGGLRQIGESLFVETSASGPPDTGDPATGGRGQIFSGFLEGSNVDPTMELIRLIKTQRAFEMNSNVIRAADETLRTVSQLRR